MLESVHESDHEPEKDPIFVDGQRPRPMFVDYKDVELLKKMINRQGRIVGRRKRAVVPRQVNMLSPLRSSEHASWPCCHTLVNRKFTVEQVYC